MKYSIFILLIVFCSCNTSRMIAYKQAKVVNGYLVTISAIQHTKVTPGQVRWVHKSTKFKEGEIVNAIVKK